MSPTPHPSKTADTWAPLESTTDTANQIGRVETPVNKKIDVLVILPTDGKALTQVGHLNLAGWWPSGHGFGDEHTFVHQARDLIQAVADGTRPSPSFVEGLQGQRVLAAVEESASKDSIHAAVPPRETEKDA